MRPWAFVEITDGSGEHERTELIRAAYRSSRSGVVALALRGITRQVVDRALDAVVDAHRDQVRGVVYIDVEKNGEDFIAVASRASIVIAETDDMRAELLRNGIEAMGVEDGARVLLTAPECIKPL